MMAGLSVAEILDLRLQRGEITAETYSAVMAKLQPAKSHTVDRTPTPLTFDTHGLGVGGFAIPLINPEPLPEASAPAPTDAPSDDIAAQLVAYINSHPSK